MTKSNHCIIFIPGFKGSILHDENENFIWPNVLRAQFSRQTLHYDLPALGLSNCHQYHTADIVKSVPIIPHFLYIDIYGHFLEQLENKFSNQANILSFHYDWRDHLSITISNLNKLIIKLKSDGINKIDLICHSMGGLIASYLLRYGKDNSTTKQNEWALSTLVNKIYFIATPFQGSIKFLKNIINGDPIGLNKTLLSQSSLFSFPSIYYLLPFKNSIKIKNDTQNQEQLLSDMGTWENFKLDILNYEQNSVAIYENRKKYLINCLADATMFHSLLHATGNETSCISTKLIHIASKNRKSLSGLEICMKSNKLNWQYDEGDGTVSLHSTLIPNVFSKLESKNYLVTSEHAKMLADKEVQEIIWQEIALSLTH